MLLKYRKKPLLELSGFLETLKKTSLFSRLLKLSISISLKRLSYDLYANRKHIENHKI